MGDEWTEPDTSEEHWMQPWEEDEGWPEGCAGPEYTLQWTDDTYSDIRQLGWPVHDFYAPRARWVSDR